LASPLEVTLQAATVGQAAPTNHPPSTHLSAGGPCLCHASCIAQHGATQGGECIRGDVGCGRAAGSGGNQAREGGGSGGAALGGRGLGVGEAFGGGRVGIQQGGEGLQGKSRVGLVGVESNGRRGST
jgi:hypothetical protein